MLKPLLIVLNLSLLVGCASVRKDPYQSVTVCKKLHLSENNLPADEYVIPPITTKNTQIINNPLPPDLS